MGNRAADAERLSNLGGELERKRDWPLVVRRARPDDEAAVLRFATNTWNGWDYMPNAWPVWLAAPDGVMLVATRPDDDTPIAVTRVAMVSPTEGWWEGIRVDPELRGMEVAADLQVAELHWSAAQGASIIRYATSAQNEGSHRLGARHDVNLLAEYTNYWWSPEKGDPHDPSGFDPEVREQATRLRLRVRRELGLQEGILKPAGADTMWTIGLNRTAQLYEPRPWAMGDLTWDRFRTHVDRGEVISFEDNAMAIMLKEQLPGEDSSLRLAYLGGATDPLLELLHRVVLAADKHTVRFRLPLGDAWTERHHDRLIAAGYQTGEWPLHILGRWINSDHPLPEIDPTRLILTEQPSKAVEPLSF